MRSMRSLRAPCCVFATTPMMVNGTPSSQISSPSGSFSAQYSLASRSLTIATRWLSTVSERSKSRPRSSGTPMASKYPGLTLFSRLQASDSVSLLSTVPKLDDDWPLVKGSDLTAATPSTPGIWPMPSSARRWKSLSRCGSLQSSNGALRLKVSTLFSSNPRSTAASLK